MQAIFSLFSLLIVNFSLVNAAPAPKWADCFTDPTGCKTSNKDWKNAARAIDDTGKQYLGSSSAGSTTNSGKKAK